MKVYKCKYCGDEFLTPWEIGGHTTGTHSLKSKVYSTKFKENNIILYLQNPKKCLNCKEALSYEKRDNTFCSQHCAAIHNNKKRGIGKEQECNSCGKSIKGSRIQSNRKYCSKECESINRKNNYINNWLSTGEPGKFTGGKSGNTIRSLYIRNYLLEQQKNRCAICGLTNIWNEKMLSFILDHVDGNCDHNNRENLRLICPNCDTQTETYKGKNKGYGRRSKGYKTW